MFGSFKLQQLATHHAQGLVYSKVRSSRVVCASHSAASPTFLLRFARADNDFGLDQAASFLAF